MKTILKKYPIAIALGALLIGAALMICLGIHVQPAIQFAQPDVASVLQLGGLVGMTTLAGDKARAYELGTIQEYPVVATDIIFEGAAVGENGAGYARPLVGGDPFLGFAESKADNALGQAGGCNVRTRMKGQVQLAVVGAATIAANDRPIVYAIDDDTFTLTALDNTPIGRVSRWIASGVAIVEFDALTAAAL